MPPRTQQQTEVVTWPTARPALNCIMCGRQVGEVVDGRILHHANCSGTLTQVGRMLRCCNCGGSVIIEELAI